MKRKQVAVGAFFAFQLIVMVVAASTVANNKCCYWKANESACSDCIGWDNDGDEEIDWYMDIGDHGAKRCKAGETGDNCTEAVGKCATVSAGATKFKTRGIGGFCSGVNGVTSVDLDIEIDQCDASDTQCAAGSP